MEFLYFILYLVVGIIAMGVMYKLYASNKMFSTVMKKMEADDIFNTKGDEFIFVCLLFVFVWPLIVVSTVMIYPFAWIKHMYETRWSVNNKNDNKNDGKFLEI